MDRDLGGRLGHALGARHLGDAGALELDLLDQATCALRQRLHGALEIEPCVGCAAFRRCKLIHFVVERQIPGMAAGPAQMVDELVARDRMSPGRHRARRLIGMAGEMQRQQRFLQHVLGLARLAAAGARQQPAQITAQACADGVEEDLVRGGIAGECGDEDRPELGFEFVERQDLGTFPRWCELCHSVTRRGPAHKPALPGRQPEPHIGVSL